MELRLGLGLASDAGTKLSHTLLDNKCLTLLLEIVTRIQTQILTRILIRILTRETKNSRLEDAFGSLQLPLDNTGETADEVNVILDIVLRMQEFQFPSDIFIMFTHTLINSKTYNLRTT